LAKLVELTVTVAPLPVQAEVADVLKSLTLGADVTVIEPMALALPHPNPINGML
jgi:hypothetical protein